MNLVLFAVRLAVLVWSGAVLPIVTMNCASPFSTSSTSSNSSQVQPDARRYLPDGTRLLLQSGSFLLSYRDPPLQTHQLRASAMSDNDRNIELVLADQLSQNSISYQDMLRHQSEVFLILN